MIKFKNCASHLKTIHKTTIVQIHIKSSRYGGVRASSMMFGISGRKKLCNKGNNRSVLKGIIEQTLLSFSTVPPISLQRFASLYDGDKGDITPLSHWGLLSNPRAYAIRDPVYIWMSCSKPGAKHPATTATRSEATTLKLNDLPN